MCKCTSRRTWKINAPTQWGANWNASTKDAENAAIIFSHTAIWIYGNWQWAAEQCGGHYREQCSKTRNLIDCGGRMEASLCAGKKWEERHEHVGSGAETGRRETRDRMSGKTNEVLENKYVWGERNEKRLKWQRWIANTTDSTEWF